MTTLTPGLRRLLRRDYLTRHARDRRAADRENGARRIDVTLRGTALDDYAAVKAWLDEVNQHAIKRGIYNRERTAPEGVSFTLRPARLSDNEVIRAALSLASSAIEDERRGR